MKKVLVGGCFDLFHYGHLHFLKEAKKLGDYLIVLLESDATVKKLKGNSRPIHNEKQRKEMLESLKFVDEVILLNKSMNDEDYRKIVDRIKPDIIAITKSSGAKKHVYKYRIPVHEVKLIKNLSSTKILGLT